MIQRRAIQLLRGAHPLGHRRTLRDVTRDRRRADDLPGAVADRRDRHRHVDQPAVPAPADDLELHVLSGAKPLEAHRPLVLLPGDHRQADVPTDRLRLAVPVDPLRRRVPADDHTLDRLADHRVIAARHDRRQLTGKGLRTLALGDVQRDTADPDRTAVLIRHRVLGHQVIVLGAVRVRAGHLKAHRLAAGENLALCRLDHARHRLAQDLRQRATHDLRRVAAHQPRGRHVDESEPTIAVTHRHVHRRVVKQRAQFGLACTQVTPACRQRSFEHPLSGDVDKRRHHRMLIVDLPDFIERRRIDQDPRQRAVRLVHPHHHPQLRLAGAQGDHRGMQLTPQRRPVRADRTPARIHRCHTPQLIGAQTENPLCRWIATADRPVGPVHHHARRQCLKRARQALTDQPGRPAGVLRGIH